MGVSKVNKLKDLIHELCPNGVEYKKLADCCALEKGNTPIQKAIPGEFPLVVTTEERKSCNTYQFDKPTVCIPLVSSRGHGVASLNSLYYQEGKFALGNILCGVTPVNSDELSAKFLFYYLNHKKDTLIVPLMRGGANVSLTVDSLKRVRVPVPPISVQCEIVRIFDKFESFGNELTAELVARKKQYEYYRKQLLSFDASVPLKTINDVCIKVSSGGTPSTSHSEYYNGTIPWLRTQEVDWRDIYDTAVKITQQGMDNSSAKYVPKNCVIVAMYGATAAKVAINKIPLTTNQACCNLEIDPNQANYRYVFYWLSSEYENLKALGQGPQSNINAGVIKSYPIPVPSLDVQNKIVSLLDKFDILCSDIAKGLPAEIEARQKQYEHYRNKLLTFEQLP